MKKNKNILTNNPEDYFFNLKSVALNVDINSFVGEVVEYNDILSNCIVFRILSVDNNSSTKKESLLKSYPLNPNFYTKPIPGQLIKIIQIQGIYYYMGLYQQTNNENGDFASDFAPNVISGISNKPNSKNYVDSFNNNETTAKSLYDEKDFVKKEIPSIIEKAGDTIIKGMSNNNIILSHIDGYPVISLVTNRNINGYNENNTGVHIFDRKKININYNENIIKDNIQDDSESGYIVIHHDNITIHSNNNINLVSSNTININSLNNIYIDTNENLYINSNNILLGKNADEPIVLGNILVDILNELIDAITSLTVNTSYGPTTTPINNAVFKKTQKKLKNILSKKNYTI